MAITESLVLAALKASGGLIIKLKDGSIIINDDRDESCYDLEMQLKRIVSKEVNRINAKIQELSAERRVLNYSDEGE